ncbi:unnamed protein product [Symbiodinium microadriaticum]|nr:unnamed protein product [Symbiodinium microadriaticum]
MRFSCSVAWIVICVTSAPPDPAEPCPGGEQVWAYFAGEVDFGDGVAEPCNPSIKECWFDAEVQYGPDEHGVYHVVWADGTPSFREVHGSQLLRLDSDKACGTAAALQASQDRGPIAPTLLLRLHWEASDDAWHADAVAKLREDFGPEEVIDDFDWHVIMRFKHTAACEEVGSLGICEGKSFLIPESEAISSCLDFEFAVHQCSGLQMPRNRRNGRGCRRHRLKSHRLQVGLNMNGRGCPESPTPCVLTAEYLHELFNLSWFKGVQGLFVKVSGIRASWALWDNLVKKKR